jgi:hypothetical protein
MGRRPAQGRLARMTIDQPAPVACSSGYWQQRRLRVATIRFPAARATEAPPRVLAAGCAKSRGRNRSLGSIRER